jgi:hypothetical protein
MTTGTLINDVTHQRSVHRAQFKSNQHYEVRCIRHYALLLNADGIDYDHKASHRKHSKIVLHQDTETGSLSLARIVKHVQSGEINILIAQNHLPVGFAARAYRFRLDTAGTRGTVRRLPHSRLMDRKRNDTGHASFVRKVRPQNPLHLHSCTPGCRTVSAFAPRSSHWHTAVIALGTTRQCGQHNTRHINSIIRPMETNCGHQSTGEFRPFGLGSDRVDLALQLAINPDTTIPQTLNEPKNGTAQVELSRLRRGTSHLPDIYPTRTQ